MRQGRFYRKTLDKTFLISYYCGVKSRHRHFRRYPDGY